METNLRGSVSTCQGYIFISPQAEASEALRKEGRCSLVEDGAEELQTWQDLSFWDRGLHDGRDDGDPDILSGDVVCG